MKNKRVLAIVAAICVVALIDVILFCQIRARTDHTNLENGSLTFDNQESSVLPVHNSAAESEAPEPVIDKSPDETEANSDENELENRELENTILESGDFELSDPNVDVYPSLPEVQTNTDTDMEENVVTFPYSIPNTDLSIQNIASYDGIFLEDGSDSSVLGVYSIVLKNNGSMDVEYARITLSCDGMPITFEVSDLPAGATVVAMESDQNAYQDGTYRDCNADIAEIDGLEQSAGQILVQENEDGSLTVSNLTDSLIPCVRLFYKFYMSDENVYIGGITYTAKLTDLEAGDNQTIIPSHYSSGYSKVVMVRTYDSKE